jgi:hypothetical protein
MTNESTRGREVYYDRPARQGDVTLASPTYGVQSPRRFMKLSWWDMPPRMRA